MSNTRRTLMWSGIGLVGLPGSGKSVVASLLAEKLGIKTIVMGDVVREEARQRGIPENPEEMRQLMITLRKEEGEAVVALKCLQKISGFAHTPTKLIIIDGLRSVSELEAFQQGFRSFYLISIRASPKIRFYRLQQRDRSDDPSAWETFEARDVLEAKVGVSILLERAEYSITNEQDLEALEHHVQELAEWIKQKETQSHK